MATPWIRTLHALGNAVRETGQALDRVGCRLQGNYAFKEELCRHRRISPMFDKMPSVSNGVFITPSASVIGDVTIGERSSIWFGSVLRGDVSPIEVGKNTSIGDRVVVHGRSASTSKDGTVVPTIIGDDCYVGQGATLHGCTMHDGSLVDVGALVLDGCTIESSAWVAPGSVVLGGTHVKQGQYWAGNPAKFVRDLTDEEMEQIAERVERAFSFAQIHEAEMLKQQEFADFEKQWDLWTHHKPGAKRPEEEGITFDKTDKL